MTDSTPGNPQKRGRCPRCGKEFRYERVAKFPTFPFCSKQCRDVDLGNWMSGKYVIPGQDSTQQNDDDAAPPISPYDRNIPEDDDGT